MKRNEIELRITLRGKPAPVVDALANGLPPKALEALRDGMIEEIAKRKRRPAKGRTAVRLELEGTAHKRKGRK